MDYMGLGNDSKPHKSLMSPVQGQKVMKML